MGALERAAARSGPAILLGALAAAVAFCTLTTAEFRGIRDFGFISGTALLLAFSARPNHLEPGTWLRRRVVRALAVAGQLGEAALAARLGPRVSEAAPPCRRGGDRDDTCRPALDPSEGARRTRRAGP